MNTGNKKVIRSYIKEISSKLTCPAGVKRLFLGELKNEIALFATEKTELSKDDLYERFGAPDEIAVGFFDRENYDKLFQRAKRKATFWRWIGIIAVILCIILVYLLIESDFGGTIVVSPPYVIVD